MDVKQLREREIERERQTDRQTDRDMDTHTFFGRGGVGGEGRWQTN